MKKQLLLGSALLAAMSAFPQSGRVSVRPLVNMADKWAQKYEILNKANEGNTSAPSTPPIGPQIPVSAMQKSSSAAPLPVVWNAISGSMNVFGVLVSSSKPLQYNEKLNAVSFVHRKSLTYAPIPYPTPTGAETGAIVASITQNWGTTWDSTCVWNDNNNWARYPQGGLYNPAGNTNIANAYVVATGPITQANTALGWIGNFFASKQLNVYDKVASTVPNAQQFIANTPPYGPVEKADFARIDFTSTDDGFVRTLGSIYNNANGTSGAAQGFRGIRIIKGTFVSGTGTFNWTSDSIALDAHIDGNTGLPQALNGRFNQAWNDAGTIGYVWYYGSKNGRTGNNIGYQPIVKKTTNSGLNWVDVPDINFNDMPTFKAKVLDHLYPCFQDVASTIPFFNFSEGNDGTVDINGDLHIVSTLWSASRSHPDSIGYAYTDFTNWDGETYSYVHGATTLDALLGTTGVDQTPRMNRPYIYDFYTSGTGWNVAVVDSMPTEAPGESSTDNGFGDNPWDINPDGGTKVSSDARLQVSRTADGSKIIYTWAESDTGLTNQGRKWNHLPNLRARLMDVVGNHTINPTEVRLTSAAPSNPLVKDRALMHNTSPKCAVTATSATGFTVTLPIKVTNNQSTPLTQLLPNTHWYASAPLEFNGVATPTAPPTPTTPPTPTDVAVGENQANTASCVLYPNPTSSNAHLFINMKGNDQVSITVYNNVGQVVRATVATGQAGENRIPVNVEGLSAGIYMVNVKLGDATSTKKLVLE